MTEVTKIRSKVKRINGCDTDVDVSVNIRLDEAQANYVLTVTKAGCQIRRASE